MYQIFSIIDHTLNKSEMVFHTNLDLLSLNVVCLVMENGNLVLEKSRKMVILAWIKILENSISLAVGTLMWAACTFILLSSLH